jgi:CRP-like cAMP-binding protein
LVDVAARLSAATENERSLAFDSVSVRLARYLCDYGEWTNDPGAAELRLDLNQDDMAAAIAATRRSVAKDIIGWQKAGILERRGQHYRVLKPKALYEIAGRRLHLTYSLRRR